MPTTYTDRAAADAILKDFFLGPIRDQLNSETILAYRLQKNEEIVEGRYVVMPLHTGRNVGIMSRRESGVVANGSNLPVAGRQGWTDMRFLVRYNYGRIKMTGPVMASARTNRGAFARVVDEEVKGLVRDLKNDLNRQYWGDGSGRIGIIKAITPNSPIAGQSTFNVKEPWDVADQAPSLKWFQVGDRIVAEDITAGAGTTVLVGMTNASATSQEVIGVNLKAKTITVSGVGGGAPEAGVGDAIVRAYDVGVPVSGGVGISNLRGVTGGVPNQASDMMGLVGITSGDVSSNWTRSSALYNPVPTGQVYAGAPSGVYTYADLQGVSAAATTYWAANTNFNGGVPRPLTTDLMQQSMDEAELKGQATATIALGSYSVRRAYVNLLTADRRYVNEYELDGGFKAVDFNGIPLVPEKDAPEGTIFFLSEPNLGIARMSDFYWLDKDGAILSRVSGVDEWDAILAYYAELYTDRRNAHSVLGDIAIN